MAFDMIMDGLCYDEVRVAVVGSSGRRGECKSLTEHDFQAAQRSLYEQIIYMWKLEPHRVVLVSGGSSWADGVAVAEFVDNPGRYRNIEIYTPCSFVNGAFDTNTHCGALLNDLHSKSITNIGRNTLRDIDDAVALGGSTNEVHGGFMARNDAIARTSDYLVAFTTKPGSEPDRGSSGTYYTWKGCAGRPRAHLILGGGNPLNMVTTL